MVLGKPPASGRRTNLDHITGQGPTAHMQNVRVGVLWTFFLSSIIFLLTPFLWETGRYRLKYCLKRPLNPNQLGGTF